MSTTREHFLDEADKQCLFDFKQRLLVRDHYFLGSLTECDQRLKNAVDTNSDMTTEDADISRMFRNVVHRTAELMDSNEEQLEQFANHLKRVIPENPPPKTVKATTKRNGRGAETNKGENSDEATKKIVKKPKKQTDDQVQEVLRRSTRSSGLLEEQLPEKQVQENRGGKTAQKSTQ